MVWSRVGWGIWSRMVWGRVDRGMVDRDRESMGGSMGDSMVRSSMKGSMVYRGCVMERGSMVYKWCSMVQRSGMEGCVVYRGTEDTMMNGGSVKGVGMGGKGVGGYPDVAFGTKTFMGVLVGFAGVMWQGCTKNG